MARRASRPAPRVDALDALLERRARRLGAAGGRAWVDLARVLAWTTPRDRDDRAASDGVHAGVRAAVADGSASRRRSRRCGWPPPKPPTTTTSAAGCWSRRWTRSRRRNGARCCWRGVGVDGARGAARRAGAGGVARGAGDRSRVLGGVAGDRPGRGGRRAAADRRDPPGGAARGQPGAAARAARGRAPVRRGRAGSARPTACWPISRRIGARTRT